MNASWDDVRLFLAVAESGSLSAAARTLRLGQPTVSRRLAEMEDALGFALFRRHVSGAVLTAEGERLLEPARRMAEWAGEVARATVANAKVEGQVRITAAPGLAFDFLAPFAAWVRSKHPGIRIEVLSSLHHVDLVRREADLALRWGGPTSKELTVVASLEHDNRAFVSKAYAARLPRRYGMTDVDWIGWAPPFQDLPPNPQLAALIPGFRPVFTSDNFLVNLRAAESGLGALVLGDLRHRFTRTSALVPLSVDLGQWARARLSLVCARTAMDSPRVRLVAELLQEELERAASART